MECHSAEQTTEEVGMALRKLAEWFESRVLVGEGMEGVVEVGGLGDAVKRGYWGELAGRGVPVIVME